MDPKYKVSYNDLDCQAVSLPEDIMKMKWAGYFDEARAMIENRLALDDLPEPYRNRLIIELKSMEHFEDCYVKTEEEVLKEIRAKVPEFTDEDFNKLIIAGKLEWAFIKGEKRFLRSTVRNLFNQTPQLWRPENNSYETSKKLFEEVMDGVEDGDELKAVIHIRHDLSVRDEALIEGKILRVHLPVPVERQQIHNLEILNISPEPVSMPDKEDVMPAAYFEVTAEKGQVFSVEYKFDNILTYHDLSKADEQKIAETLAKDGYPEDVLPFLEERGPHILFTPYLRKLAAELKGDETNPLRIARAMYDYITCHLSYTFVRDYSSIDCVAESMAINRRGDCGMQAILFITLCRIAGVPARWQSGIDAEPDDVGNHDWAQFYLPSIGWVYADLSFGMGSKLHGNEDRWNFYFGNIDPYRIPLNCDMQYEFNPPRQFLRFDTVDNQLGEIEYADSPIRPSVSVDFTDLGIRLVK